MNEFGNDLSRRDFIRRAAAAGTALSLGGAAQLLRGASASLLPSPSRSGISHIIVLMMENRSFDHFLGWMPDANGTQAGLSYSDSNSGLHSTHVLADNPVTGNFQGCGMNDPDHSFAGGRIEYNGGACDGWRKDGAN